MAGKLKNEGRWVNSLFGILWLGTWFWYIAGITSIAVSIEHLKPPANLAVWWFLMKAALPWAACGLVWTGFYTLTLRPWFMSGSVTTQDVGVLKRGCYISSGFVAVLVLAALYRWYLPVLNLPENMVFKTGNTCRIIGLILTITATVPIVSFVMAYLIKLSIDRSSRETEQIRSETMPNDEICTKNPEILLKIGQFTALVMFGVYGLFLLMLIVIGLLSLMVRTAPRWYSVSLIFLIAALAFLYAIFAYGVTRGHRKACLLIFIVLYLDTFLFKVLTGAMIYLIPIVATWVPFGYFLVLRRPQSFWTICGFVMLVVMFLLLCGVIGVYKAKREKA